MEAPNPPKAPLPASPDAVKAMQLMIELHEQMTQLHAKLEYTRLLLKLRAQPPQSSQS